MFHGDYKIFKFDWRSYVWRGMTDIPHLAEYILYFFAFESTDGNEFRMYNSEDMTDANIVFDASTFDDHNCLK